MADQAAVDALRDIILRGAYAIAQASTVAKLDSDLVAAGLPPSQGDDSKAKRAERSAAAVPDDRLHEVAIGLLNQGAWLHMLDRMAVQDLVWAEERHPRSRSGPAVTSPGPCRDGF